MDGYFLFHRKALDNPLVTKDAFHFTVWWYLIANATHTKRTVVFKGEKRQLYAGQLITTRKRIADKFHMDDSKVTRILNEFESDGQIIQETSNKNRLITIINWDKYQCKNANNANNKNGIIANNKKNNVKLVNIGTCESENSKNEQQNNNNCEQQVNNKMNNKMNNKASAECPVKSSVLEVAGSRFEQQNEQQNEQHITNNDISNNEKNIYIRKQEGKYMDTIITPEVREAGKEIIAYLNAKTNKNLRANTVAYLKHISARLKEGYSIEDFKHVIDVKCQDWMDQPKMRQYLNPNTLFAPSHFDVYLNQELTESDTLKNYNAWLEAE